MKVPCCSPCQRTGRPQATPVPTPQRLTNRTCTSRPWPDTEAATCQSREQARQKSAAPGRHRPRPRCARYRAESAHQAGRGHRHHDRRGGRWFSASSPPWPSEKLISERIIAGLASARGRKGGRPFVDGHGRRETARRRLRSCPVAATKLPGGGHENWLWYTFRGADVARVASGIDVIWVIMVGM